MRLVSKANLTFLQFVSQDSKEETSDSVALTFTWQTHANVPDVVRDCVLKWHDGISLNEAAKRLLTLYAQCADNNSHVWFCPPAPDDAMNTPWSSMLPSEESTVATAGMMKRTKHAGVYPVRW